MHRLLIETHYGCDGLEESNRLSIFAMIALVFFVVTGVGYAAYLLIDASGISDVAGIHITKSMSLAASQIKGQLYTDPSRGIKDWMIHTDVANGFEIKHPNDWDMQNISNSFLLLKKYKDDNSKNSSLSATVEVGSIALENGQGVKDAALKKGIVWQDDWKEEIINGRRGVRTGKVRTVDGLYKDAIFWNNEQDGKIFYLEATYFTNQSTEFENIFTNMISEFKFI